MRNCWTRAAVPALVVLLAGCSGSADDAAEQPRYVYDDAVNAAITEVANGGDAVPLRDVAHGEWDEVALFIEGATREEVEAVVGPGVVAGDRFTSTTNLMVFRQDGELVALRGTSADVLDGEYATLLGPDAVIAPAPGRAGLVVLTNQD